MIGRDTKELIWAWALHNMQPWLSRNLERAPSEKSYNSFNKISQDGYLFNISHGSVDLIGKPIDNGAPNQAIEIRLNYYLEFFRSVVGRWLPTLETIICICVSDDAVHHPSLPTFSFQKVNGWAQILIPDIDFLTNNFYIDAHQDALTYHEKSISAIFVGATTGGLNTVASVKARALPRLNAADYFSGRSDIKFLLPSVVQVENDEARAQLQELPYCSGKFVPWADQLRSRFLISMDGNGATCSRVYLALLSNSALLKYASPYKLYYFDFLRPMRHYIAISQHSDVEACLEQERQGSAIGAAIAASGRSFALRFLGREAVEFYMAALLKIYSSLFVEYHSSNRDDINQYLFGELIE